MCYSYQTHTLTQSHKHSGVQKMSIPINTGNCIEYKTAWWRARGQCNIVDQRKLFLDAHLECTKKQAKVHFLLQEYSVTTRSHKKGYKSARAFEYSDVLEGIRSTPGALFLC